MAVCIGFVRSQFSTSGWTRCGRRAARCGRLCREHRDGLEGAVLGILQFEERQLDQKALKTKKNLCKRRAPVWDARNAAAATTTPERLEPDPARACPAPTLENEKELTTSGSRK
jgi:hypothetical protein